MSREIKFRAYWKKHDAIHDVVDIYFGKNMTVQSARLFVEHNGMSYPSNNLMPSEFELMQYTGIFDSNGTEICEGDMVRRTSMIPGTESITGRVVQMEGCWSIENGKDAQRLFTEVDEDVILGTIYDVYPE